MGDDDPNLRKRRVYGRRVVGAPLGIQDVSHGNHVDRIVLTEVLSERNRAQVVHVAHEAGVRVSEWFCEERVVSREPSPEPPEGVADGHA